MIRSLLCDPSEYTPTAPTDRGPLLHHHATMLSTPSRTCSNSRADATVVINTVAPTTPTVTPEPEPPAPTNALLSRVLLVGVVVVVGLAAGSLLGLF